MSEKVSYHMVGCVCEGIVCLSVYHPLFAGISILNICCRPVDVRTHTCKTHDNLSVQPLLSSPHVHLMFTSSPRLLTGVITVSSLCETDNQARWKLWLKELVSDGRQHVDVVQLTTKFVFELFVSNYWM